MTNEQQKNVFRMAAIIYGRSDRSMSINKSHQRVIDDALYCYGKESVLLTELIVYINREYLLLYSPEEIIGIVVDGRDAKDHYMAYYNNDNELVISLTPEYKTKLTLICGQKTLYDYIDEFIAVYELEANKTKDLLLRFLYEMFTSNLEGYKLLLQEKFDAITSNARYSEEEKNRVNDFLNWQDEGKNKAVYDLAGYSLEYCMMTNKKNTSLNVQNLKYKSFYIDTNIIYRAIGLNGDNYKTRADLFLSKFKDVGEKLVISQSTYIEFLDTIDYYIDKIEQSQRPKVRSQVISEFINEDSIFLFYHKWCVGRHNRDSRIFRDWIMSEFDSLMAKYNIEKDEKYPYDKEARKNDIDDYVESIHSNILDKPITSAVYDAENVLWVEEKRKGSTDDIYQAKAFFLSSDNGLRRWDYQRNFRRVPIVMSPSQWLSIILHYVERTSDDYKSFVSFLTMNVRTEVWPIEMLTNVIAGIAEATNDIEQQQYLVRNFIERNTFEEMENKTDKEIEHEAETFAKTELEKRIEVLEESQTQSEKSLKQTQEELSGTQKELEAVKKAGEKERAKILAEKEEEIRKNKEAISENERLKEKIAHQELKKWKSIKIIIWVFVLLCSVFWGSMIYLWKDQPWNFMAQLVAFVDSLGTSSASSLGKWLLGLPIVLFAYSGGMIVDACDMDEYDKKRFRLFWKSKKRKIR
jgi:hypothetical protein